MDLNIREIRHRYMAQKLRMDLAYQIRLIRIQRDLGYAELSCLAGVGEQDVKDAEDWALPFPSIDILAKLGKAFDVALTIRFTDWDATTASIVRRGEEELGTVEE